MAVKDWSTTAGSNTGILSGLTLDGAVMTPPQVDNAFRDMAAQIASQLGKMGFKGADIASAATTNLANATGWFCDVTGTTTITAFGTVDAGLMFILRFTGVLTLTHNASSLILPEAASRTTAANDVAFMLSLGSGNWHCVAYQRAVSTALTITPPTQQVFSGSGTWTKPTGCTRIVIEAVGGGGGSGGVDGQGAGKGAASGGGGSGYYGKTGFLDVSAVVSAAVTIGAAGAAGAAAGGNGGSGGNTSITIGATTYIFGGGAGSIGLVASVNNVVNGGTGGVGTNVVGGSTAGGYGFCDTSSFDIVYGGFGGGTPLGTGGSSIRITVSGASAGAGQAGTGFGAGASGAVTGATSGNTVGGAGTAGYMRVWEYYS